MALRLYTSKNSVPKKRSRNCSKCMSTNLLPHWQPPEDGNSSSHRNRSSGLHVSLWTVISTVPPPQSRTMTTLSFTIYVLTVCSLSSLHWMLAPSGSRLSRRLLEFWSSMIPACSAALRMKNLCSSLHKAGTVKTHLTFVLTTLPTYSVSFAMALSAIYFKLSAMTFISGSSRPSSDIAFASMCSKWSL